MAKSKRQKSNRRQDDFYTLKAQKEGFLARSIYKLEEIDKKFTLFQPTTRRVLDIGCSPGSRLQYASKAVPIRQPANAEGIYQEHIIGLDLKPAKIDLPGMVTYIQDATDRAGVETMLRNHAIPAFDVILSDMAPDTIGNTDIDALRSIAAVEQIERILDEHLAQDGKFVLKVFMGPGFDEMVKSFRQKRGTASIRLFKPKSSRKASKETFIIKI